jgi:hypothetical protein
MVTRTRNSVTSYVPCLSVKVKRDGISCSRFVGTAALKVSTWKFQPTRSTNTNMHWLVNVAHNDGPVLFLIFACHVFFIALCGGEAADELERRVGGGGPQRTNRTRVGDIPASSHVTVIISIACELRRQLCKCASVHYVYIAKSAPGIEQKVFRPGKTQNPTPNISFITAGVFGLFLLFWS